MHITIDDTNNIGYITIDEGQLFINSVREDVTAEEFLAPISTNDVVIVTLDRANLNKSKQKSSFGGKYVLNKSYVAVVNVGTSTSPKYEYYFAAQDSKGYAVPLTNERDLDPDKVVARAKNKMEVTIQSLCGSEEGTTSVYSSISGLDSTISGGATWNATIFSTKECGKID